MYTKSTVEESLTVLFAREVLKWRCLSDVELLLLFEELLLPPLLNAWLSILRIAMLKARDWRTSWFERRSTSWWELR